MVLHYMSLQDLKNILRKLLEDPQAGDATRKILLGYEAQALESGRLAAQKESEAIDSRAREAYDKAVAYAREYVPIEHENWPQHLEIFLPRVRALMRRGAIVDGPAWAWEALGSVIENSIYDKDDRSIRLVDFEDACDWFHEKIDILMLEILRFQKDHDPEWLRIKDLRAEINQWRTQAKTPEGPCTYRYERTMRFLDTGEVPEDIAVDGDDQEVGTAGVDEGDGDEGSDQSTSDNSTPGQTFDHRRPWLLS